MRIETSTRELFTSAISQHIVKQSSASCVGRRKSYTSGVLVLSWSPTFHKETQALVLHCLVLDLDDHWDCHCFCSIRRVRTCHPHCWSLLSTRSCWLHSCILSATFLTASSFAFLASLSGQILGALRALSSISLFLCASLGPLCSLLLPATSHPS